MAGYGEGIHLEVTSDEERASHDDGLGGDIC